MLCDFYGTIDNQLAREIKESEKSFTKGNLLMSKKSSVAAEANIMALTLPRAHPMMVVVLVMDLLQPFKPI